MSRLVTQKYFSKKEFQTESALLEPPDDFDLNFSVQLLFLFQIYHINIMKHTEFRMEITSEGMESTRNEENRDLFKKAMSTL